MPGLIITKHEEFLGNRFMVVVKHGVIIGYVVGNLYDDFFDWFKAALKGIKVLSIGTKKPA